MLERMSERQRFTWAARVSQERGRGEALSHVDPKTKRFKPVP
jgi:hypothetical protein